MQTGDPIQERGRLGRPHATVTSACEEAAGEVMPWTYDCL
jgi:hypothetical protein